MPSWSEIARRIRVPVGFIVAAFYLSLAQPSSRSLWIGSAIVALGVALRAYASGYVRKASELTTSGPYAYTRNPLYLGSSIIAAGFAIAACNIWITIVMAIIFVAIYIPVIGFEERFLRAQFSNFDDYARRVPRLLPRFAGVHAQPSRFSFDLYRKHREYNAALGAAAMLVALTVKLLWLSR